MRGYQLDNRSQQLNRGFINAKMGGVLLKLTILIVGTIKKGSELKETLHCSGGHKAAAAAASVTFVFATATAAVVAAAS